MIEQFIEPNLLKDNAYCIENKRLPVMLSVDDKIMYRKELSKYVIWKMNRVGVIKTFSSAVKNVADIEMISEVLDSLKAVELGAFSIKDLDERIEEMTSYLKSGYKDQEQTIYGFVYSEENQMVYYGEDGNMLFSRALEVEEYQTRIVPLRKAN